VNWICGFAADSMFQVDVWILEERDDEWYIVARFGSKPRARYVEISQRNGNPWT
jgi:hypothetical protein